MNRTTLRLGADGVETAARLLAEGKIVALPTETVYGLAADSFNQTAVEDIYRAKGRAEDKPLSVLLSGMDMVLRVCRDIPTAAYHLAEAFWPGPLTMVLPSAGLVAPRVTAGGATLGVRCPDHPLTLAVIRSLGRPLAAPSANPSGMESPKNSAAVLAGLDGRIDALLDGGACSVAIESTVVDLTGERPSILRHGGLSDERIWEVLCAVGGLR